MITVGVVINAYNLYVNAKNNGVLDRIAKELKDINDDGSLRTIAQIGKNNIINNKESD
ncbi:hypothetical protein [Cetobacterium sp.]|uniref:hypothetical protein n=1 Tax=Cetobacterium sp. TaxID=2071632 RepID=UPI002FCA1141